MIKVKRPTHPENVVPKSTPTIKRSLGASRWLADSVAEALTASVDPEGDWLVKKKFLLAWFLGLLELGRKGRLKLMAATGLQPEVIAALRQIFQHHHYPRSGP